MERKKKKSLSRSSPKKTTLSLKWRESSEEKRRIRYEVNKELTEALQRKKTRSNRERRTDKTDQRTEKISIVRFKRF